MAKIINQGLRDLQTKLDRVTIQRDLLTGRLKRLSDEMVPVSHGTRKLVCRELDVLRHRSNQLEIAIYKLKRL